MIKFLFLIVFHISSYSAYTQANITIDQNFTGNTVYGNHTENIESLSDLPSLIQFNINGYLKRVLGAISDSVTFSHGQIIDLKKEFETDSLTFNRGWIIPKYDLAFFLTDRSLRIKRYYIQIRMDEYGQILNSNWPRDKHSDKNKFQNWENIDKYIIRQAEIRGYSPIDYEVDLKYNRNSDKLCWVFKFPAYFEKNRKGFNAFEIPMTSLKISNEYRMETTTSH